MQKYLNNTIRVSRNGKYQKRAIAKLQTYCVGLMALTALSALAATPAAAVVVGFVNNPSSNSTDWANAVTGAGHSVNSNVNFNDMSIGTFNGGFYTVSDGVTMSVSGGLGSIDTGAGPGQRNQAGAIPGEGVHAASNFLFGSSSTGTLIIDFGTEVFGAGLSLIDQFSNNSTNIEAFSDVGATGTSLGLFSGLSSNFQNNGAYFMGLTSDIGFRSLIFRDLVNNGGDTYGIDDIVFATGAGGGGAVPEPGMLTLLGVSLLGFGAVRRGRRKLG
jgi:hypothetical protein